MQLGSIPIVGPFLAEARRQWTIGAHLGKLRARRVGGHFLIQENGRPLCICGFDGTGTLRGEWGEAIPILESEERVVPNLRLRVEEYICSEAKDELLKEIERSFNIREVCECGHVRTAHIYSEGSCRPGHICPTNCRKFVPAKGIQLKAEYLCPNCLYTFDGRTEVCGRCSNREHAAEEGASHVSP